MKIRGSLIAVGTLALAIAGCAGADGKDGKDGSSESFGTVGGIGQSGPPGATGKEGASGKDGESAPVASVVLPGNAFFPESVAADATGKLYVSSAGNGSIVTVSADGRTVKQLVAPDGIAKLGLFADDAKKDLWACTLNAQTFASTLRRYDLATGTQKASFPMASAGGVCNDIAVDAKGNLYVTDSFFGIERLVAGGAALEVWKNDPLFTAAPNAFAVDGIAVDGNDVYVDNLAAGSLIRVPIAGDGSAQGPVAITIKNGAGATVSLAAPDGIRLRSTHTLLVAESFDDSVSELKIDTTTNTAVREIFANHIDRPSGVAVAGGAAWIAEGQIGRLFQLESTPVSYPFHVRRVPLH